MAADTGWRSFFRNFQVNHNASSLLCGTRALASKYVSVCDEREKCVWKKNKKNTKKKIAERKSVFLSRSHVRHYCYAAHLSARVAPQSLPPPPPQSCVPDRVQMCFAAKPPVTFLYRLQYTGWICGLIRRYLRGTRNGRHIRVYIYVYIPWLVCDAKRLLNNVTHTHTHLYKCKHVYTRLCATLSRTVCVWTTGPNTSPRDRRHSVLRRNHTIVVVYGGDVAIALFFIPLIKNSSAAFLSLDFHQL